MVSKNSEQLGTKRLVEPEEDKSEEDVDDFKHYVDYKKQTSNVNESPTMMNPPEKSPLKRLNTARSLESPSPLKMGHESEEEL